MKKVVLGLIIFFVFAGNLWGSEDEHSEERRLQNNGWLKIVDQYVEEKSNEEWYKRHGIEIPNSDKERIIRQKILHVKIEFLKPCKATSRLDEYVKEKALTDDPDENIALIGKEGEIFVGLYEYYQAIGKGEKDRAAKIAKKLVKRHGDIKEYITPKFRCDYRLKVFLTAYSQRDSKKNESSTSGVFPVAPIIDKKLKQVSRKREVLSGETMWLTFSVTGAKSWKVWVPQ